jgi:hypothetical protein
MTFKTRSARLEAIIDSSLIVDGTTNIGTDAKKKRVYNKERYEQNREEILKYRREGHRFSLVS